MTNVSTPRELTDADIAAIMDEARRTWEIMEPRIRAMERLTLADLMVRAR